MTIGVLVEVATASARLPNREFGFLSLRHLAVGTRQRRPNQSAMYRTVIVSTLCRNGLFRQLQRVWSRHLIENLLRRVGFCRFGLAGLFFGWTETDPLCRIRQHGLRFLASRRWYLCVLVLVIRITRRAARLFHLVVNHGDNDVIGDTALARTVVVQNVTEPKPALLHQ
jgi:hypothetical protein